MPWDNVEAAAWSIGELCSGITCACLPTLRPLLGKVFSGLAASGSRSDASKNRYAYGSASRDPHPLSRSTERQSRRPQDSQEEIYISSLRDVEKGYGRREQEWVELSDNNSEGNDVEIEMKRPTTMGVGEAFTKPVLTTECSSNGNRPKVPPKNFEIQVECDIVQYSSPSSEVSD